MAFGATEHPSVSQPMNFLREQGHPIQCIQVNANGQVLKEQLMRLLESGLHSLSLMLANNETGVLLDWPDLFPWLREKGVLIHGDAVQAAGKLPLDFNSSGAHCLSMSAHKIYGPKGVGALIMDRSLKVSAILHGGGQEMALRGGTENLPGIVGFGRAAELAQHELQYRAQHCLVLREKLEQGLARIPGSRVFAEEVPRLPNTTQISLSGIDGETLVMLLDRKGIAVSSGSACASALHEPSPVLLAMGVAPEEARRAVRISLGKDNTAAEVDTLLASLEVLSQAGGHQ
jgi:cysteine desulfurase